MSFQIYRQPRTGVLLALVFFILSTALLSSARDTEVSGQNWRLSSQKPRNLSNETLS